jgi:hypothetical protein
MLDGKHTMCAIWQQLIVLLLYEPCIDPLAPASAAALQEISTRAAVT